MVIEISPPFGHGPLVRLEADQVVLRNGEGTPICVAMTYGPDRCVRVAHLTDPEFPRLLSAAGLQEEVQVERLELPRPPAGARLWTPR